MKLTPKSNTFAAISFLGASVLVGCGILGDKDPADRLLQVSQKNAGCLDNLGPLVENYVDGAVSSSEWQAAWTCLDDQLDLFVKFVRSSEDAGYTQADVKALVERFLITNKPISKEFIQGVFEAKDSLFGGGTRVLSRDQIAEFRRLIDFLKDETTVLIPYLKDRAQDPTTDKLRGFMNAVDAFGNRFADYLKTDGNPTLSRDSAVKFLVELTKISFPKVTPEEMQQWADTLLAAKHSLVKGEENGIGANDWKEIIRFGVRMGSVLATYFSIEGKDENFEIELAYRAKTILDTSVSKWSGAIPLSTLDRIVVHLPVKVLEKFSDRAEETRDAVRKMLVSRVGCMLQETPVVNGRCDDGSVPVSYKPTLTKILSAKTNDGLDADAFQRILEVFTTGKRADFHLAKIYSGLKESQTKSQFAALADAYLKTLPDTNQNRADIARLKALATRYPGLHVEGSGEIVFGDLSRHSHNNLSKMSWYESAAMKILQGYGSKDFPNLGRAGTIEDLFTLTQDIKPLLVAIGMAHPLKTKLHSKRFREANSFMPSSDGDDVMNLVETTEYISILFSSGKVSTRMSDFLFKSEDEKTGLCPKVGMDDVLKIPTFEIGCVRREQKANYETLLRTFPQFVNDYDVMTPARQDAFWKSVESASKPFGYDENPLSSFDVDSYSGISHFVETVMYKYDRRGGSANGTLDWTEINDNVFPVFKRELASLSGINIGLVNRALLIYLAQNGRSPFKCGKPVLNTWAGWKEILDIIKWLKNLGPWAPIDARRIRIYEIFETLSNMGLPNIPGCSKSSSSSLLPEGLEKVTEVAGEAWLKSQPEYQQTLESYPQDR